MFRAFIDRRPWAVLLVCLIFGPVLGMLYLNRGKYAVLYFLAGVVWEIAVAAIWPGALMRSNYWNAMILMDLPLRLVGAAHGHFLARQWDEGAGPKWYARWYSALGLAYALPLLLAFGARTFLYRPFDVPAASMEPNVNPGDYFLASRIAYDFASPARGDVIVFHSQKVGVDYVKRIVGLPGDGIQLKNGTLFINGVPAAQRRISDWPENCGRAEACQVTQYEESLPGGRVERILDRDPQGPLDNTNVFVVPADQYFVLGDNRDNSNDSRLDVGYVARSDIIGRAAYKYIANGHWTWQPVR